MKHTIPVLALGLLLSGGSRLSADVVGGSPAIGPDAGAPPLTLDYGVGQDITIRVLTPGGSADSPYWYHNDVLLGPGTLIYLQDADYADAGLYYVRYTSLGQSRKSQNLILTIKPEVQLTNISTRCYVTADKAAIAGFIVNGIGEQKRFLIRGIGPSLSQFGVASPLPRPKIQLFRENTEITSFRPQRNGNADSIIRQATARTQAFALADGTDDMVGFQRLSPGAYTVILSSEDGASGKALVEVYEY